jgi:hypothetical protein
MNAAPRRCELFRRGWGIVPDETNRECESNELQSNSHEGTAVATYNTVGFTLSGGEPLRAVTPILEFASREG